MASRAELDSKAPNGLGTNSSPTEMEAPMGNGMAAAGSAQNKTIDYVLHSEIGINILLGRLKQSIASARDFAAFLNKRSILEDGHAQGLRKLSQATQHAASRSDNRQGSYALGLDGVTRLHERMADNGQQFAASLHQMHEEVNDLSNNMEQGRKQWKHEGLSNEKRVKDAESLLEKAKTRYDTSADNYYRAKTGEGSSGRAFGIKGPKSAEQREEDLHRKVQSADADYQTRVQAARAQRAENLTSSRPHAIKAIQELIRECDSGLTLQLQRFAAINEQLLVANGLVVSPLKADNEAVSAPSMREMIQRIDNEKDLHTHISGHAGSVPPKPADIKYERHPAMGGPSQPPSNVSPTAQTKPPQPPSSSEKPLQPTPQATPQSSLNSRQPPSSSTPTSSQTLPPSSSSSSAPPSHSGFQPGRQGPADRSFRGPPSQSLNNSIQPSPPPGPPGPHGPPPQHQPQQPQPPQSPSKSVSPTSMALGMQPRVESLAKGSQANTSRTSAQPAGRGTPPYASAHPLKQPPPRQQQQQQQHPRDPNGASLPPYNRVFGMSLDELFRRDDSAVPFVVYQCIQAVDLFGMEVQGIYRQSGNAIHVAQLRAQFDRDPSRVDFRNPETFFHDVNSVAGLLKQFFRELPDSLFTTEHYGEFVEAARLDDDTQRRDSLHAIINSLPDPNYATLRAIILHLNRVQERAEANSMSSSNLAICFAPSMMGPHMSMADSGLQARVIDTILQNTYQIFDED